MKILEETSLTRKGGKGLNRWFVLAALVLLTASFAYAEPVSDPLKWSQMPDMGMGLDWSTEVKVPSIVADDWLCTNGLPVTDIHWWGSYWVPTQPGAYSHYSDARPGAPPGGITMFILTIWTDVPVGPNNPYGFSYPGRQLWQYQTTVFNEVLYGVTQGGGGNPPEEVYQYYVKLPRDLWFWQEQGQIYWLSIEAVMLDPTGAPITDKQWGWHESKDHWNDAAVQDFKGSGWVAIQNNLYYVDMAFELTTIPEPGSLLALGTGIAGIVGIVLRKRRA